MLDKFLKRTKNLSISIPKVAQKKVPMVRQVAIPLMIASLAGLSGCASNSVQLTQLNPENLSEHELTVSRLSHSLNMPVNMGRYDGSLSSIMGDAAALIDDQMQTQEELKNLVPNSKEYDDRVHQASQALVRHMKTVSPAFAYLVKGDGKASCHVFVDEDPVKEWNYLQIVSGLPKDIFEADFGTPTLWKNMVLLHETQHCLQDQTANRTNLEFDADRAGLMTMKAAGFGQAAEAWKNARLVSTYLSRNNEYAIGYRLSQALAGEEPTSRISMIYARHELAKAADQVSGQKFNKFERRQTLKSFYALAYGEQAQSVRDSLSPLAQDILLKTGEALRQLAPSFDREMTAKYQGQNVKNKVELKRSFSGMGA